MSSECEKNYEDLIQKNNKLKIDNNKLIKQNKKISNKKNVPNTSLPSWFSNILKKTNKLFYNISQQQSCDDECKREKKLAILKKKMEYALKNENEDLINKAQNNYYSYRDGNIQNRKRFYKKYIEIGSKQQEKYKDLVNILNINIINDKKNLLSFFIAIDNINNIINITKNQNKKLKLDIDEMISAVNKNDRKFFYKQQYLNHKSYIKYILSAIFIIACLVYLYLSDFFNNFMNDKVKYISIIILMISYLFIVNNLFYYMLK